MLKSDFHAHTNYVIPKHDSKLSPKQIIDFAASKGYEVFSITEHACWLHWGGRLQYFKNPVSTYFHIKDYAKKKGILLIPGVETIVEGKEIVLLNFEDDAKKIKTFADVERLKDENVTIMAPHPFYKRPSCLMEKLTEHIKIFDAIEYCHFYTYFINLNKEAVEVAKKYNKPLVATSDAHDFNQINTNFTMVDSEKNIDSVLEAVRKNKIKIVSRPLPITAFFWITMKAIYYSMLKKVK